jgi:hypothetical protein
MTSDFLKTLNGQITNNKIPFGGSVTDIITNGGFNLLDLVFFLIGLAFFANLATAAFSYIFGEGSPDKINKANTRILNSLMGLAIVFLAFVLVRIVLLLIGIPLASTNPTQSVSGR